ncbi:MAG: hypothetical protein OXF50_06535 [Caldilineaceae bacterium]|nr:hypothetical protein [Caldilineaceae bacterium]
MTKAKQPKRKRGRPPKTLPTKPDNTPYTPEEVAHILTSTSPQQLDDWRQSKERQK